MQTAVIQRQYDQVVASNYDTDPHGVIGRSLRRARRQLLGNVDGPPDRPLRVLDLGLGTGRFLEKLSKEMPIEPYGLDLSRRMIDIARARLPDLQAEVDDAANAETHFPSVNFDVVCTHFLTGFVPMSELAPTIHARLVDGGYWSFVGGTKAGFPRLQKLGNGKLVCSLHGGAKLKLNEFVCNPADEEEVVTTLAAHGFAVCASETFAPRLFFRNFDEFLRFAYLGGWLTPIIEGLGLHRAGKVTRTLLNACVFPVRDHHSIVVALAKKVGPSPDTEV
jgi:SAM-dependent methyltransferase